MKSRRAQIADGLASDQPLTWLQAWYYALCDGNWEHGRGLSVMSMDNPGWWLRIPLAGTGLENVSFPGVQIDRTDYDWLHCQVKEETFEGVGGPLNLDEIASVFKIWAAPHLQPRAFDDADSAGELS